MLKLLVLLAIVSCSQKSNDNSNTLPNTRTPQVQSEEGKSKFEVYMSPHQGTQAFEAIYKRVREAKKSIKVTIYSWSDADFNEALHFALDKKNPPIVRIAMRRAQFKKHHKTITALEAKGAMFKVSKINLHEKFFIIDGDKLINSSANLSGGAENKYSEDFVFIDALEEPKGSPITSLFKDFENEFAIIWNSASDYITEEEVTTADVLDHFIKDQNTVELSSQARLLSTSMNYRIEKPSQRDRDQGAVISLDRKPSRKLQLWTVRDGLIKHINNAKKNIFVSINHFNLEEISDALIAAVKRGVDVKMVVDSLEFHSYLHPREKTPLFVSDYKKLKGQDSEAPVRIKFYSLNPHYSSWSLNHHKYMLIDYDEKNLAETKLLAGSYNYSKTAEHAKFDNQVLYKGSRFTEIIRAFKVEFDYLWSLERGTNDVLDPQMVDNFSLPTNDLITLHTSTPFSLKWKEAVALEKKIKTLYPDAPSFGKHSHCAYYHVVKKVFIKRDRSSTCP